jgi:DNA gyrase/topoisomerase IV subunit B
MYIGPPDQRAVYQLVRYACAAALSTTPAQTCSHIALTIAADHSLELRSTGHYAEMESLCLPDALTQLATEPPIHPWSDAAGALAVLNALAADFELEVWTGQQHVSQRFAQGQAHTPAVVRSFTAVAGRRIRFVPDRTILTDWDAFSAYPLMGYLRTVAALYNGLRVTLHDARDGSTMESIYQAGIRGYLAELTYAELYDFESYPHFFCSHQTTDMTAEVALHWGYALGPMVWSYVNGRATLNGGSHVTGMRQGLTHALDQFARDAQLFGDDIPRLRTRDLPRTLAAIISIHAPHPHYDRAMKQHLHDPQIGRFVYHMLVEQLPAQFRTYAAAIAPWATSYAWRIREAEDTG